MTDEDLRRQDEVLQLLYWMNSETLGMAATAEEMNVLLRLAPADLQAVLDRAADSGLLAEDAGRYLLTEAGLREGRRRFADEFGAYLGRESHVECSDPNCDCHSPDFSGVCRNFEDGREDRR